MNGTLHKRGKFQLLQPLFAPTTKEGNAIDDGSKLCDDDVMVLPDQGHMSDGVVCSLPCNLHVINWIP